MLRKILLLTICLLAIGSQSRAAEPKLSKADSDIISNFLSNVSKQSILDLKIQRENLQKLAFCLKGGPCDFVIHSREFRSDNSQYQISDIPIASKQELLDHFRRQALQYWVYGGLADAENLVTKLQYLRNDPIFANSPRSHIIHAEPLPGLNTLPFEHDSPEAAMVEAVVKNDVSFYQLFNQGIFQNAGVKEKAAKDIFDRSEACSAGGCFGVYYYRDFIQPLYRMFLKEMVQSQPYLNHLRWDLDAKDFGQALKKSISNIDDTVDFVGGLKEEDRLLLISFTVPTETVLAGMSQQERANIERILAVIESQKTFWAAFKTELKKPELFGVLGCYGAAAITPIKVLPLICHTLGLTVAAHSVYTSATQVSALNKLQQLQIINPKIYNTAAIGLAVEAVLSALYVREVAPSLFRSFSALAPGALAGASASSMVVEKEFSRQVYDQLDEILKKIGVGKFFSSMGANAAIFDQLLTNEKFARITYRGKGKFFPRGILTAHEIIGRVMASELYLMMLGVHSRIGPEQKAAIQGQIEKIVRTAVDEDEKTLALAIQARGFAKP